MAQNPNGAAECSIEVFGSWVTETAPENLPIGVSPDCPDNVFAPGQVGTRPAFQKIFNPPLEPNATITYGKSFVTPTGAIKNLYLSSLGNFYVEDVISAPGVANLLFRTTPGTYCKSVTAFGREYIAISDGLHGQEAPLQFDGDNVDRVTADGPGAPPTVRSLALASSQMTSVGNTLTRMNNQVLCSTETPHNLKVGYQSQISNIPDSNSTSVNQNRTSGSQTTNGSGNWSFVGNQWRSNFNPGVSALPDLVFEDFGFTIPSTATILGVVVSAVLVSQAPTSGTLSQVALWYANALLGTIKTPGTNFTTALTAQSYGSAGDQWGAALTPAIVNDPSFGFAMAATCDSVRVFIGQAFTVTVYYTLSGSGTVAIVESIAINNETNPGLALVTTTEPHGLVPDIFVSIVGVEPGAVANISAARWSAGTTTLTTMTSHGLSPGSVVQTASIATATGGTAFSFNGTFVVATVPSPNELTYAQQPITATDPDVILATANTGNIVISWPVPDTPAPTYFEVVSCPTPTTFLVAVSYSDGTWSTGTVGFAWEGTFYVIAVLSPTAFKYQQYGPDGSTTAIGTVTPFGQAAPGQHQLQVSFLDRQGGLTRPSPPVMFIANGGQYLAIDDLAIGPSTTVARVIEVTGALGSRFFYLPAAPQVNGLVVGTATQINDNTTTSVVLDFSDNSLYAGLGTSIPGNNLAAQIVIDGALSFLSSSTRLGIFGQRNRIQGLLNMGFDGGYLPSAPTLPSGWTSTAAGGAIAASRFNGFKWSIDTGLGGGTLSQSFYQDGYGAPIATSNTLYKIRYYLEGAGTFQATISSVLLGFTATATIVFNQTGWYEATFTAPTPETIPIDLLYTISGISGAFSADEGSLIYAATPYLDTILFDSYVNNPTGIDGISGKYGPSQDTRKVMAAGIVRGNLCLLTQEPSGRLHEVIDNGTTEPSGWTVNELEANCGILSAFALTQSQADDSSSSGGEEWMAWASESGARIFGGADQWKISQEIQPNWRDTANPAQVGAGQINMAAALTAWALNDPVERVIYFGLPLGVSTSPSQVYPLNYREMDDAYTIAHAPPFHPSLSGKLIATDNTRKWCYWQRPFNGAARMYRGAGELLACFFAGNGATPGAGGFGNVYLLNPALSTDDDFGAIGSYYITCALPTHEQEESLQLGSGRKLLAYFSAFYSCIGNVMFTMYRNKLAYPWPITFTRPACTYFDQEMPGGNIEANRIFFKIQPVATVGTDCRYLLTRFIPWIRKAKIPVRGAAR